MRGSTNKLIPVFQLSVDPLWGGSGSVHASPPHPHIHMYMLLIPIPTLQALSRDLCADGKWGSYLPHTSHHRVPLASEYPGLPSATLIRTASANRKTETNEGKTKA
jgi:hypothetical protein